LSAHGWPGNVRELKHAVEYAAALVDGDTLELWHLPESLVEHAPASAAAGDAPRLPEAAASEPARPVGTAAAEEAPPESREPSGFRPLADEVRDLERRRIAEALRACNGVQRRAAQLIGVPLRTFSVKLKQYGFKDH
jgi:DNA-binding NtrC family response regulator